MLRMVMITQTHFHIHSLRTRDALSVAFSVALDLEFEIIFDVDPSFFFLYVGMPGTSTYLPVPTYLIFCSYTYYLPISFGETAYQDS